MNKEKTKRVLDYFKELYPDAHCELNHRNVFELLVAVMLSAQTTDKKVNQITPGVLCLLRTIFLETTYASCSGSTPASISNFVFLRIFGAFKASPSLSPTLPMKR